MSQNDSTKIISCLFTLEDNFESLYDVNLETGEYSLNIKGETFSEKINHQLVEKKEFFEDSNKNADIVVYQEDREEFKKIVSKDFIRQILEKQPQFDWYYRLIVEGKPVWFKLRIVYETIEKKNVVIGIFNAAKEIAAKEKEFKNREDVIAKMMGGDSLYILDTETDKFSVLHRNRYLSETYSDNENYSSQIKKYIQSDVNPSFRDAMTKACSMSNLIEQTKDGNEYCFEYGDTSDGISKWYRMRAVRLSEHEILLGFANKDSDISNRIVLEKVQEDYFGIFGVNLDEERIKVLKAPKNYKTTAVGTSVPYKESMLAFACALKGEAKEYFTKLSHIPELKKLLKKEDKISYYYKSDLGEGNRWVNMTGYVVRRHPDGSPFLFAMNFSLLDAEASEKEERFRLKREAYESQKLMDSIVSSYNIAYLVNMKDDTFKVLRMDEFILGYGLNFENFSQAKDFFLTAALHPSDRTKMERELNYSYIRDRLSLEKSYDVEYRALIKGTTIWHIMNVTYIDDDVVAINFAEKDLEITKRHIQEKRYDDYFALYVVDIDTQSVKSAKPSPWYSSKADSAAAPYRETMLEFANSLDEEPKAMFIQMSDLDYVKRILAQEDKHSFSYRSKNVYGGRWVIITIFVTDRKEDGTPSEFTLGFSYADSMDNVNKDVQEQLREDMQMIGGLAEEYIALFYVNMDEGTFKAYSLDEDFMKNWSMFLGGDMQGPDVLRAYGQSKFIHPDDRYQFENLNNSSIRRRLRHEKKFSIRFRRDYNGDYHWLEMDVIKYEGMDERANAIAIGFADRDKEIRYEVEQQAKLRAAYKAAEIANEAKSNFLFNMSHDIRTPMNAITGFTTMAKKHVDDKEKVIDYLDKIDISSKQLLQLINQVLEMSRIESGKVEFNNRPVNLKEKFNSMVPILAEQAREQGITFHSALRGIKHVNLLADDARMSQITLNIAGNALKYTPEGGRIDFEMKELESNRKGYATFALTVQDTGIGMSKEFQKELFQPFAREKSSTVSKVQGTGLGLSIVKNLVDLLGGTIKVESEPGKGTKFVVTIDFMIDNEERDTKPQKVVDRKDFRGRRVLLVEDNELNREIARCILEDEDVIVEEAEDGDIAVQKIKDALQDGQRFAELYDFILMDVQMPRMDGYEATTRIHGILDPRNIQIPIIALSANAFEEDKKKSREAGMNDHIAKPIDIDELWATLAKYL